MLTYPNVRCVADCIDKSDCSRTLCCWLVEGSSDPGECDHSRRVERGWQEHHCYVTSGGVEGRHRDDVGNESYDEWSGDVVESFLFLNLRQPRALCMWIGR